MRREGADPGRLQALGKHLVVAIAAEEIAVALHFAGVATAEQAPQAHRGVRRQRVGMRVRDRAFLELRQIRRDRAFVSRPRHVRAQAVHRDEQDIEVRRRSVGERGDRTTVARPGICVGRGSMRVSGRLGEARPPFRAAHGNEQDGRSGERGKAVKEKKGARRAHHDRVGPTSGSSSLCFGPSTS
jgi:hypothetical protein